jgi:hypothetical protein
VRDSAPAHEIRFNARREGYHDQFNATQAQLTSEQQKRLVSSRAPQITVEIFGSAESM